ncbi:hypothetical protein [Taibaiella koreensis]|uniref:hypothetical protein n=1 Tax=Taibaiella koreensis TaxID=1268548 RepID=UPI000E5A0259|nr:hypothetical protein [Taibaiella koreensis]
MKKCIFILAAALVLFSACSQMSEKKYNDTVANMYTAYATNFASKVTAASSGTDKEKSMSELKSITKSTDSCISVMNGLKPSEAAKDFHEKVLKMFQIVKTDYVPAAEKLLNLNGSQDVEAYNKAIEAFNAAVNKINTGESDAQTAQRTYAAKVGIKIK